MSIVENYIQLKKTIPAGVQLIAVSKTRTVGEINELYKAGQFFFGENRVQEMLEKHTQLPLDIEWHLIGHLQTNKVKYIAAFVSLIHSVDSLKLLQEINQQAKKNNRIINCLLQIHIAEETTKFGFTAAEVKCLFENKDLKTLSNINITGLMGMASNTKDKNQVREEFTVLYKLFNTLKTANNKLQHLSMGMSDDYQIAIETGSTMVRIGSSLFQTNK